MVNSSREGGQYHRTLLGLILSVPPTHSGEVGQLALPVSIPVLPHFAIPSLGWTVSLTYHIQGILSLFPLQVILDPEGVVLPRGGH